MRKLLWVLLLTIASVSAAIQVTPANPQGWFFLQLGAGSASADLVAGPGTPPLGAGSVALSADADSSFWAYVGYANVRLDSLENLRYSTYTTTTAPLFVINVDYNLLDGVSPFQGRLFYDPALNGAVVPSTWQTWDMKSGVWYGNVAPGSNVCSKAAPCTFDELLAAFPNIGVNGVFSAIIVLGDGEVSAMSGNADALTFGTDEYDFDIDDADGDGVVGSADLCPDTVPDVYRRLGVNQWVWDGTDWITRNIKSKIVQKIVDRRRGDTEPFTMQQTRGCSCAQILEKLRVDDNEYENERCDERYEWRRSCSARTINKWIDANAEPVASFASLRVASTSDAPSDEMRRIVVGH